MSVSIVAEPTSIVNTSRADDRQARAQALLLSGAVRRNGDGGYVVTSQNGETEYLVDVQRFACTCPDHLYRHIPCKHLLAAVMAQSWEQRAIRLSQRHKITLQDFQDTVLSDLHSGTVPNEQADNLLHLYHATERLLSGLEQSAEVRHV